MSEFSEQPEQDTEGSGELPTYDDLAAQKGPNSRFGRWKGWVEKRAAERYLDLTPEERARRRERGWGETVNDTEAGESSVADDATIPSMNSESTFENIASEPPLYFTEEPPSLPPPTLGQGISPSHLSLYHLGSRFLPHAESPIRCLLPLMNNTLLLIGHDDGLSVIDLCANGRPDNATPTDAEVRKIWVGEGVFQLELLEFQETGDLTPYGVVLALVGPEVEITSPKEHDAIRSIRMYSLASLVSLARWAIMMKGTGKPIDLRRPANWSPQQAIHKKHKHSSSLTKLRLANSDTCQEPSRSQYPASQRIESSLPIPQRTNTTTSIESSWDVVDELPLRWATDFVALASQGSRLLHTSVLFFHLKRDSLLVQHGQAMLAVATKSNILLYQTPKGERAFNFIKEFYTPLQPRSMAFVHQRVQDTVIIRTPSRTSGVRPSLDASPEQRFRSLSPMPEYNTPLSLFVVFDKKAGLIRLADSSVGEVELFDESPRDVYSPYVTSPRRQKTSLEALGLAREAKGTWLPPSFEELPIISTSLQRKMPVYLMTRGKQTHVIQAPLPSPLSSIPPVCVISWSFPLSSLCHRICQPNNEPDFLQVIGLGEDGVEIQELPLSYIFRGKGKGRADEPVRTFVTDYGSAGFLFRGPLWYHTKLQLARSNTMSSFNSLDTIRLEDGSSYDGFFIWCQRDLDDWRVMWIGGSNRSPITPMDI